MYIYILQVHVKVFNQTTLLQQRAVNQGMKTVRVKVSGLGPGRMVSVTPTLVFGEGSDSVVLLFDITCPKELFLVLSS